MMNLILLIQQISKSVLPYKYYIIINHPFIRIFRLIACISIIILFLYKDILYNNIYYLVLSITYIYVYYQCIIITIKFYYVFNTVIEDNNIKYYLPINYCKTIYYIILLLLVIWGVPFISDTIMEIIGDIKHIIMLFNHKNKK